MKVLHSPFFGFSAMAVAVLFSIFLMSHRGYSISDDPSKSQVLTESAKILQKTRPDLAKKLFQFAYQEEQETERQKRWNHELVKILKDSSKALQGLNPAMARRLSLYADRVGEFESRKEERDREEDIELLRDSGAFLRESDPILAGKLTQQARAKAARLQWIRDMESMEDERKQPVPVTPEKG